MKAVGLLEPQPDLQPTAPSACGLTLDPLPKTDQGNCVSCVLLEGTLCLPSPLTACGEGLP